jgi:hypothetical protein
MIRTGMSGDFVEGVCPISWSELRRGLALEALAPAAVTTLAERRVAAGDESAVVLELAGLRRDQTTDILELVDRLAELEPGYDEALATSKWLLLVLLWVYSRRDLFPDPLATAEIVYSDFGYPKRMAPFIRYMPAPPGAVGRTQEERVDRMLAAWVDFMREEAARLGCTLPTI